MRYDGKTNKQKANVGSISRLSVVTRPAHEGALATIIKSAAVTPTEVEKQTFMEALSEIQIMEQMEEFLESMWDYTWALRSSIREVLEDSEIENKKDVIQQNIRDFATAMSSAVSANNVIKLGEDDMKKEEIDAMIKAAVDPLQAKLTTAEAMAKMNDETKGYFATLDETGKADFLKMSPEDQASAIKTANEVNTAKGGDDYIELYGQRIDKSAVDPGILAVITAQQAQLEKSTADLEKERQARNTTEYAKQADALYGNLPGETTTKGQAIQAIHGIENTAVRDCVLGMLKAGNTAVETAKSFDEIGHNYVDTAASTPTAKLNKMAEDKAAAEGITFAKAYSAVMDTPEGAQLYQESLRG